MIVQTIQVVGESLARFAPTQEIEIDVNPATAGQRAQLLRSVEEVMSAQLHVAAGRHRLKVWADGWAENFAAFTEARSPSALLPRYFGKYPEIRLADVLYVDNSRYAEVELLRLLQSSLLAFARGVASFSKVAEFGAGTGHNLLHLAGDRALTGLTGFEWSWSGVACMQAIGESLDPRIGGLFFDYFEPGLQPRVDLRDTCVFTVASMEQIGADFRPFLKMLRHKSPTLICNIEPMQELMGDHELGRLSAAYARRRNYLDGYFDYLVNLEQAGEVEILLRQESLIGSKFLNGYGVVVWRWR